MISVMRRTFAKVYKARSLCEATNITAASPVDCEAALATKLSRLAARLDARGADCAQSTGLAGCLFPVAEDDGHGDHVHQPPPADPACLSSAALLQAGDLVEAVFGPAAD
jgi:hypothetical protein